MPPVPPARPSAELAGFGSGDEVDPELTALPQPPRAQRTRAIVVLVAGILAALAMVVALARDAAYALGGSAAPADIGDLGSVSAEALAAHDNGFVRGEGLLGAAGGIRYERPLQEDTFRALPVSGRGGTGPGVWVEVRVPYGRESGRFEPPRSFSGRLVRLEDAGPRHRGMAAAIASVTGVPVPAGSFLLVDGEGPAELRWSALLALVFMGFAVGHGIAIGRLVRRVH